jgi:cytochrome b6-f complex iron-sulfur subunit
MPLIDDLKEPIPEDEHSRRLFLAMLGGAALAVAGMGTGITAVRFLWPEVLFEEETRYRIGRPDEIPPGTVLVLPAQKAFIVHGPDGFYALSATCTHLGCMTQYERDGNRIFCPCHGSRFSVDGEVVGGPAPSPLTRFHLAIEAGALVLDVARAVDPGTLLKV